MYLIENFLPNFIKDHWILCTIAILIIIAIIYEEIKINLIKKVSLTPTEAITLINEGKAIMIDLRNPHLFATGYILGSINIPHNIFEQEIMKLSSYKKYSIILIGIEKINFAEIKKILMKHGFIKDIFIMIGDIGSWKELGLPLMKKLD